MSNADDRHGRVSRRAYELWEREGGEHGRHEDHWHRAAGEVDDEDQAGPAAPATAPDDTPPNTAAPVGDAPAEDAPAAKTTRKRAAPTTDAETAKPAAKPRKPKAK